MQYEDVNGQLLALYECYLTQGEEKSRLEKHADDIMHEKAQLDQELIQAYERIEDLERDLNRIIHIKSQVEHRET